MTLITELRAVEKRLSEQIDGIEAEQITINGKLDDLDFRLGEIRDVLGAILALLEPEEE